MEIFVKGSRVGSQVVFIVELGRVHKNADYCDIVLVERAFN